jgi:3-oxoacyl-[acyl-carrier-protein] synthase-3
MPSSRIVSTGSYLPSRVVTNQELVQFPAAVIPLIEQKTGVRCRHHAEPAQCTSDLAILAARQCLDRAHVSASAVEAVILATSSPDRIQPATATRVQAEIGAGRAFAFDVNSVCTGAVYSLAVADALIRSGQARLVLVVASEVYSKILNPTDFSTFPYFGDGAGAVLLEACEADCGIVRSVLHADGTGHEVIQIPAGGTMLASWEADPKLRYFTMRGREVFEFAVSKGSEVVLELLAQAGVDAGSVRWVISHQANRNIIDEIARRTGIERDRFVLNLDRLGNTAAASVLIALDELAAAGTLRRGDQIVLVAFGGGLTWGATLVRWTG